MYPRIKKGKRRLLDFNKKPLSYRRWLCNEPRINSSKKQKAPREGESTIEKVKVSIQKESDEIYLCSRV